jgi:hypothetical protein
MAQAVRAEPVGAVRPGGPGQATHHAEGGRLVEATAAGGHEQRPGLPAAKGVVDGTGGGRGEDDGGSAAALAGETAA